MCRVLEVSVSGFYACRKEREWEDGKLAERIVEMFQEHRGVYGVLASMRCCERKGCGWYASCGGFACWPIVVPIGW